MLRQLTTTSNLITVQTHRLTTAKASHELANKVDLCIRFAWDFKNYIINMNERMNEEALGLPVKFMAMENKAKLIQQSDNDQNLTSRIQGSKPWRYREDQNIYSCFCSVPSGEFRGNICTYNHSSSFTILIFISVV